MTRCIHQSLSHLSQGWCPDCDEPLDRRLFCPRCHRLLEGGRMACPGCGLQVPGAAGWPSMPRKWEQVELLMQINRGNLGVVYAARDGSGELVAVRIVPRPGEAARKIKGANARECEYAGRFPLYEGILKARAHGVSSHGQPFLIMDLCRGATLDELLGQLDPDADALNPRRAGEPLSALRTVRLLRLIIGAAARMHRFKLVHRDIKPSNLFLLDSSQGEQIQLGDLGRAWPWAREGEEEEEPPPAPGPLDPAMVSRDSTPYLSPEVVRGDRHLSPCSDLYSAGVVAYEACTGQLPYLVSRNLIGQPVAGLQSQLSPTQWGDFAAAWLRAHLLAEVVPPREVNPDLPPSLERCLLGCLARRPADRYQRAGDVIIQLALVEQELAVGTRKARPTATEGANASAAAGASMIEGATPGAGDGPGKNAGEAGGMAARPGGAGATDHAGAAERRRLAGEAASMRQALDRARSENEQLRGRVAELEHRLTHRPAPPPELPHALLLGPPPILPAAQAAPATPGPAALSPWKTRILSPDQDVQASGPIEEKKRVPFGAGQDEMNTEIIPMRGRDQLDDPSPGTTIASIEEIFDEKEREEAADAPIEEKETIVKLD